MTEFTADAEMDVSLPSGAGRSLKRQLEQAINPVTIEGQVEQASGGGSPAQRAANGGGGRQRQRNRREHRWARERTGTLEDILDAVRDIDGGGGGGILSTVGTGGALGLGALGGAAGGALGGLAGRLGGLAPLARGAGGALSPGMGFGEGGLMEGEFEEPSWLSDVRENLFGSEEPPLQEIERPGWLDSLLDHTPARPGWLDSLLDHAPERPEWLDSLLEYIPDRPEWLDSILEWRPSRPGWLDSLLEYMPDRPEWLDSILEWRPSRPGWLDSLLDWEPSRPDWLDSLLDAAPSTSDVQEGVDRGVAAFGDATGDRSIDDVPVVSSFSGAGGGEVPVGSETQTRTSQDIVNDIDINEDITVEGVEEVEEEQNRTIDELRRRLSDVERGLLG